MKAKRLKAVPVVGLVTLLLLACGLARPAAPAGFDATAEAVRGTVEAGAVAAGEAAATSAAEFQEADLQATAAAVGAGMESLATTVATEGSEVLAALEEAGYDVAYLEEKFAEVIANENGEITVTVQEAELNAVLLLREQAALTAGNVPAIRNVRVDFQGDGTLLLLGDLAEPFVAQMVVSFRPVITDGELTFAIESAEVGRAEVPAFVLVAMESTVNSSLTQAVARLPADVIVTGATINDTTLVVSGTVNQ